MKQTHKCPQCGADNAIVNQCGCDPNNLPTKVTRTTIPDLWHVAQRVRGMAPAPGDADDILQAWHAAHKLAKQRNGLLEACKHLLGNKDGQIVHRRSLELIRDAIAKAEGRQP